MVKYVPQLIHLFVCSRGTDHDQVIYTYVRNCTTYVLTKSSACACVIFSTHAHAGHIAELQKSPSR